MSAGKAGDLDSLIHDINSKSASLKTAARLLQKSPHAEMRELLALMEQQAKSIVEEIQALEASLNRK